MTFEELREAIELELKNMETIVSELVALRKDTEDRIPANREKTAASAYLAQFYNGVENILKRISVFFNEPLPKGDTWHIDLFTRFCLPSEKPLPVLFDESLKMDLTAMRKFRHVVHHGYGFLLDWTRLLDGINKIEDIFNRFRTRVLNELQNLVNSNDRC